MPFRVFAALDGSQPHDEMFCRIRVLTNQVVIAAPVANAQNRQVAQDLAQEIPEAHVAEQRAVDAGFPPDDVVVAVPEADDEVVEFAFPVLPPHRALAEELTPARVRRRAHPGNRPPLRAGVHPRRRARKSGARPAGAGRAATAAPLPRRPADTSAQPVPQRRMRETSPGRDPACHARWAHKCQGEVSRLFRSG